MSSTTARSGPSAALIVAMSAIGKPPSSMPARTVRLSISTGPSWMCDGICTSSPPLPVKKTPEPARQPRPRSNWASSAKPAMTLPMNPSAPASEMTSRPPSTAPSMPKSPVA